MLFKYRGIKEFRYFVDIILNQRLYAAPYFDLNDPMEGQYLYNTGELNEDINKLITGEKEKIRICSLSRDGNNELMWTHYAEGHRGVVIGVEIIPSSEQTLRPIIYDGLSTLNQRTLNSNSAIDILSHKLKVWEYEKEERVFIRNKYFVSVKVREIIYGRRMSNQDKGFINNLIEKIDPAIEIKNAEFNYV
jgi:hypothetical protein